MAIKFFLRDHTKALDPETNQPRDIATVWEQKLQSGGVIVTDVNDESPVVNAALQAKDALVFLHQKEKRSEWETLFRNGDCGGHLVVASTQGGGSLGPSTHERIHICMWKPENFDLTSGAQPDRVKRWIEHVNGGDIDGVQWSLLEPILTERLWTLQLLCEAFLTASTEPNVANVNWLELLGKDDDPPTVIQDEVIKKISSDYSEMSLSGSAAISGFLESLKNGPPNDSSAVQKCLETLNGLLRGSKTARPAI